MFWKQNFQKNIVINCSSFRDNLSDFLLHFFLVFGLSFLNPSLKKFLLLKYSSFRMC